MEHRSIHDPRGAPLPTLALIVTLAVACGREAIPDAPARARTVAAADTLHGRVIPDPYRWLEDLDAPEVRAWMAARDSAFRARAERWPLDRLRGRLEALSPAPGVHPTVPLQVGGRLFFKAGPRAAHLYTAASLAGEARLLAEDVFLWHFRPSPDGTRVAYFRSGGASSWGAFEVVDVEDGRSTTPAVDGAHSRSGRPAWTDDGFFYVRFDDPGPGRRAEVGPENAAIRFRPVAPPAVDAPGDRTVWRPEDAGTYASLSTTSDRRSLVAVLHNGGWEGDRVLLFDALEPERAPEVLVDRPTAGFTFMGDAGGRLYFHTDRDAPTGRAVAFEPGGRSTEIVPARDEALLSGAVVGHRLVIQYTDQARSIVRVHAVGGELVGTADLPPYAWVLSRGPQPDADRAYASFFSLYRPRALYAIDLDDASTRLAHETPTEHDPSAYRIDVVPVPSHDGVEVPVQIYRRKDTPIDGDRPVFVFGYGAFGWAAYLAYSPALVAWLDAGGLVAIPGIRGGGEKGEAWHRAGVRERRINAVEDYAAAARWLVEEGYTRPRRILATGGSAGSPVAAAAALRRPELFGAVVVGTPLTDMVRYHRHGIGASWIGEFGRAEEGPEMLEAILETSPYHLADRDRCHPPFLVVAGEEDDVAVPSHAYKLVARLRGARGCDAPAHLRIAWGAGHGAGYRDHWTLAFAAEHLGISFERLTAGGPRDSGPEPEG